MTSKGKQSELVDSFFTRTEKTIFAKRIAIAFMLVKGYNYRQISQKIKVSTSTVSRISDAIHNNHTSVTRELKLIEAEDSFKEFLGVIDYKISKIIPPKGGNWSVWRGRIERDKKDTETVI